MTMVAAEPESSDLALHDASGSLELSGPDAGPTPATVVPDRTRTFGTLLFIVADSMLLLGIIAAYFTVKHGSASWPPVGVSVGTYVPTTVSITVVMSLFSAQWAVFSIRGNDQRNAAIALAFTVFLGVAAANAELQELARIGFGIGDHAYGTFYYVLSVYYVVHVIAAAVMLVLLAGRCVAGHFSNEHHDPLRAGVVFWHFTVAVWLVIVTVLFVFSRHA